MANEHLPLHILYLDRTGDPPFSSTGVICPIGTTLQITLKAHYKIALKNPIIVTNCPKPGEKFNRTKLRQIKSYEIFIFFLYKASNSIFILEKDSI